MATRGSARGTTGRTAKRTLVGCVTALLAATGTVAAAPASAEWEEYDPCTQYFRAHADPNYDGIGDILTIEPTRQRLLFHAGGGYGTIGGGALLGRGFGTATDLALGSRLGDYYGMQVFWTDTSGVMRIESYEGWYPHQHARTIFLGKGWGAVRDWTVGDVTADGIDDIIGLRDSGLWLWEGDELGGFESGSVVGWGWSQADRLMVEPLQRTPRGPGCTGGVVDGHLLATFRDGRMASYQVRGDGKFGPAQPVGHGWASFQQVVLTDADIHPQPSGRLDIIGQDAGGSWWKYEGLAPRSDGSPRFGPAERIYGPNEGARIIAP